MKGADKVALKIRGSSNQKSLQESSHSAQSDEVSELKRKLYFDPVLNCQNRTKFEEDAKSLGDAFTIFSLDANNLKYCNDNFSHEAGDVLLKVTAKIGISIWGSSFYRTGGDEFIVMIRGTAQSSDISSEQVTHFKQLISDEDKKHDFPIAVSAGFATSNDANSLEDVIKLADEFMYADKKAYKEANPEYDMRKARLTSDTLKEALQSGEFNKAYRELKDNQVPAKEQEVVLVEDDLSFDGVADTQEERVENKPNEVAITKNEDLSGVALADDELSYEANELNKKMQPVLHETTTKAVKEAVKYQNDKLKLEVAEVLDDEVSSRLEKYDRRRRRRDFNEKVRAISKGVVILLVVLFIIGNQQLRLRFALVFQDVGEMIISLMKGENTSSNKLVEDLFRDLGDDLNEINTIEKDGFSIDE